MNHLLNISEGTSLAFHSLALMAEKAPTRMNVKNLAAFLDASEAHLAKIMQRLNKVGIISSVRGPAGGFVLEKPADEISFLQIYEILESPVELTSCPLGKDFCRMQSCIFQGKLKALNREIYQALSDIRLSDFSGTRSYMKIQEG